jgi:hypothetical protein
MQINETYLIIYTFNVLLFAAAVEDDDDEFFLLPSHLQLKTKELLTGPNVA